MTPKLILAAIAALLLAAPAEARRMLPNKVRAGEPAWRVEQKQLGNLEYARHHSGRFYRHARHWIVREHRELESRVLRPWMPTYDCEHGRGGWATDTGNGFYGGLQFDHGTWKAHGGHQFAAEASGATPIEQVTIAWRLTYDGWPNCPNP